MPNKRCRRKIANALSCLIVLAICSAPQIPALAKAPAPGPTSNATRSAVSSDRLLELDTQTPEALRLEGEQTMRNGNYDKAIAILKKSVDLSPSDMDGRLLYAEALEKKLFKQQDKDPVLYNFLVQQWAIVAKRARFLDQQMQGRAHLSALTGTAPRKFENEKHYLARVQIPEDGSVKVALGDRNNNKDLASSGKDEVR